MAGDLFNQVMNGSALKGVNLDSKWRSQKGKPGLDSALPNSITTSYLQFLFI